MKKILSLGIAWMALLAIACNNVDKNLVDKMVASTPAFDSTTADMGRIRTSMAELLSQINAAPHAVRLNNDYFDLRTRAASIYGKVSSSMEQYEDAQAKLKKLTADYNAGKISSEEAQKEHDLLTGSLAGEKDMNARIEGVMEDVKKQFVQMCAAANVNADTLPKNQVTVLPAGVLRTEPKKE